MNTSESVFLTAPLTDCPMAETHLYPVTKLTSLILLLLRNP